MGGNCMRYVPWLHIRTGRLLAILLATLIYFLLLAVDALRFFPYEIAHHSSLSLTWVRFGFSGFVALLFLAVSALIWLYASSRLLALLLFGFSFSMMVSFAVETEAAVGDLFLSAISTASSALALALFSTLLLLFPRNYLALRPSSDTEPGN